MDDMKSPVKISTPLYSSVSSTSNSLSTNNDTAINLHPGFISLLLRRDFDDRRGLLESLSSTFYSSDNNNRCSNSSSTNRHSSDSNSDCRCSASSYSSQCCPSEIMPTPDYEIATLFNNNGITADFGKQENEEQQPSSPQTPIIKAQFPLTAVNVLSSSKISNENEPLDQKVHVEHEKKPISQTQNDHCHNNCDYKLNGETPRLILQHKSSAVSRSNSSSLSNSVFRRVEAKNLNSFAKTQSILSTCRKNFELHSTIKNNFLFSKYKKTPALMFSEEIQKMPVPLRKPQEPHFQYSTCKKGLQQFAKPSQPGKFLSLLEKATQKHHWIREKSSLLTAGVTSLSETTTRYNPDNKIRNLKQNSNKIICFTKIPGLLGTKYVSIGELCLRKVTSLAGSCRCQFLVWDMEVIKNTLKLSNVNTQEQHMWWPVLTGFRLALKIVLLKSGNGIRNNQAYKIGSLLNEGQNLLAISECYKPFPSARACPLLDEPWDSSQCPVPQYFWTLEGDLILPEVFRNLTRGVQSPEQNIIELPSSENCLKLLEQSSTNPLHGIQRIIAVGMEVIRGVPLSTVIRDVTLNGLYTRDRCRFVLEVALCMIRSQRAVAENKIRPLINWDTKPSNIMICYEPRSDCNQSFICKRVVVIDIGDALLGKTFSFSTASRASPSPSSNMISSTPIGAEYWTERHYRRNKSSDSSKLVSKECIKDSNSNLLVMTKSPTPLLCSPVLSIYRGQDNQFLSLDDAKRKDHCSRHVICTTGFCSPECAILVFLLSCVKKYTEFRRMWYKHTADVQRLRGARRLRLKKHWKRWLAEGWITPLPIIDTVDSSPSPIQYNSKISSGYRLHPCQQYEIRFSNASVIFSTGIILSQLFGGKNLVTAAGRDTVHALDTLCEWEEEESFPLSSNNPNEDVPSKQNSYFDASSSSDTFTSSFSATLRRHFKLSRDLFSAFSKSYVQNPFISMFSFRGKTHKFLKIRSSNACTGKPAIRCDDLFPRDGLLVHDNVLKYNVCNLLRGCLRFVPGDRWGFDELETTLHCMLNYLNKPYSLEP